MTEKKPRGSTILLTAFSILLAVSMSTTFSSCSEPAPYTKETFVMGTRAIITIYELDEETACAVAGEALHELHRIENVMSNWTEDSEISRLNSGSRGKPYIVSEELFGLIKAAFKYSGATSGAFDITARPIVRLWGFQGGTAALPSDDQIASVLKFVGYDKVALDGNKLTVTLPEGMQLDLAGIGKGYGVDRCVEILRSRGVTSALVNLGGNMYAIGVPHGRSGWSIGIREPHGEPGIVGKLLLRDEAVATSGNYENFVMIDGRKYGHIVDPRTGRTIDHILAVTVVARTALGADALSTGLFVLGHEEGAKAVENIPGVKAIYTLDGDIYEFIGHFGKSLILD